MTPFARLLIALVAGQISLHACMAGVRMAMPLQALRQGQPQWTVGLLLALFAAAPVMTSLMAGRMADRHGYHRPARLAIAFTVAGAATALLSSHFAAMCLAAMLTGAGANIGLVTIQRTAGRSASDATERIRVFSWLGLSPALSNVAGPLLAGAAIDLAGFRVAFGLLMLLPLAALAFGRLVPRETPAPPPPSAGARRAWDLLREPEFRRLLLVNWLVAASWEMHTFLVPVLGHERGLSASAIGTVLGVFAAAVAGVRLLIPLLARRLAEHQVLIGATLWTAAVLAVYPFAGSAWAMAGCALLLGLAIGSVQPMVMSALHHITPEHRHGEAIALRLTLLSLSSTVMPLVYGVLGPIVGAGSLFWAMSGAVAVGSSQARRIGR